MSPLLGGDETTAVAAAAALGQIADSEASKALAGAAKKTSGKVQLRVLDAYLRCADKLAADGNKAAALGIYKKLQGKGMPKPIRTTALRGVISSTKR